MADNADIALDYISAILVKLQNEGHLCKHKVNAATRILSGVVDAATLLRDSTYKLMEAPATELAALIEAVQTPAIETQRVDVSKAVKTLSEELRIDWSLATLAEDAGADEPIAIRQRDRVHTALEALEALVEGAVK